MTLAEALKTAIELEERVRDVYLSAVEIAGSEEGRRLFDLMAREEQYHVGHLRQKLAELEKSGEVAADDLRTSLPAGDVIEAEVGKLNAGLSGTVSDAERQSLEKALEVEKETSGFYRSMVESLPESERALFARFLEIEEGHLALVQAQLDQASRTGFWFDMREFNFEG